MQQVIDAPNSSPHLTIYKAQVASLFSILQRISGIVLFVILVIFVILDKNIFYGLSNFATYKFILSFVTIDSMFVQVLIWFVLISLNYHIFNGLKLALVERYLGSVNYKTISLTLGGYYILSYVFFCGSNLNKFLVLGKFIIFFFLEEI